MIEAIANRIAVKLKEANPEETASVDVMKYALFGLIHNTLTFATALIVGLLLGHLVDTLVAAISFMTLRFVSGGYHFKTPLSCLVFSSLIFVVIPFVQVPEMWLYVINSLSLLLALIFAPSNIREHIRVPEKYWPLFKVISVIIVGANYFFLNPIITLALFVQSITLITLKKGGD